MVNGQVQTKIVKKPHPVYEKVAQSLKQWDSILKQGRSESVDKEISTPLGNLLDQALERSMQVENYLQSIQDQKAQRSLSPVASSPLHGQESLVV